VLLLLFAWQRRTYFIGERWRLPFNIQSRIQAVLQLASEVVAHGSREKDACTRRCLPFSSKQQQAENASSWMTPDRPALPRHARRVQHEAPQGEAVFSQGIRRRCRAGHRPARAYSRLALRRDLRRARR
jgi:hypothetical protein